MVSEEGRYGLSVFLVYSRSKKKLFVFLIFYIFVFLFLFLSGLAEASEGAYDEESRSGIADIFVGNIEALRRFSNV